MLKVGQVLDIKKLNGEELGYELVGVVVDTQGVGFEVFIQGKNRERLLKEGWVNTIFVLEDTITYDLI